MRTIHCTCCESDLPIEAFRADRVKPRTMRDRCKQCLSAAARAWNLAHPERVKKNFEKRRPVALARMSARMKERRPEITEYMRGWRDRNRARVNEIAQGCRERRRQKVGYKEFHHSRRITKATPPWANRMAIEAKYAEARQLSATTGVQHHVDHIYPLKGSNFSGLHIPENLRVVRAIENLRKGNRLPEVCHFE